jgi:hypothetical protein
VRKVSKKNPGQRGASAVVPSWLEPDDTYSKHYDATVGKGLCMNDDGYPRYSYETVLPNGKLMTIDTIWCFECWADVQENCQIAEKEC